MELFGLFVGRLNFLGEMAKFGGVPERFKAEGIFVSGMDRVLPGDWVEAKRAVEGTIETLEKGVLYQVASLIVEPNGNFRQFSKRLSLVGHQGDFNPKRFKKVLESESEN